MNHFMIRLWHGTKSGFYMTTSDDQLSGWTEKKPQGTSQSQMWTKKVMVTGGLLPIWSTTAFWIPVKPLHLRSMLSKLIRCPPILQCLQLVLVNRKGPVLPHDNARPKVEWFGLQNVPHPPYSPDLLPTNYHFFKYPDNFLYGKLFHNQQEAENAFQEFIEFPKHGFLCYRKKKLPICFHSHIYNSKTILQPYMVRIIFSKDKQKLRDY